MNETTVTPPAAQDLRDLARLRRARDRIDREYAQPLDVELPRRMEQLWSPAGANGWQSMQIT
jgi:hypothetical protein